MHIEYSSDIVADGLVQEARRIPPSASKHAETLQEQAKQIRQLPGRWLAVRLERDNSETPDKYTPA